MSPKDGVVSANFLEQLAAEWYEYQDYFVKRNVLVGKRPEGGYEGELDIVAFHPIDKKLVHIEASMDAYSWAKRENHFKKKFDTGKKYIPGLFGGLTIPKQIDQIVLHGFASDANHKILGGGTLMTVGALLETIIDHLKKPDVRAKSIPEKYLLIRAYHFAVPLLGR